MRALSAGLYIRRFEYGCGVITETDANRTTIDFDASGTKQFVTGLMVVELAGETPPKRRSRLIRKMKIMAASSVTIEAVKSGAK